MNKVLLTCFILLGGGGLLQAQLFIGNGGQIHVVDSAQITLHEVNLQNNGLFDTGDGTVKFKSNTAGADLQIGGDSITVFHHLRLDVGVRNLRLENESKTNGDITFETGQFDLNGHDMTLGPEGMVMGEGPNGCFVGNGGGYVVKPVVLNAPSAENPGNLGAMITSAANLGETIVKRGHQEQVNGADVSILRYYEITPTSNSGLGATLRFHYLDEELNGLTESELVLFRNAGAGWVNRGHTALNTTDNYIELTGIDAFSAWTAFPASNPLPVELVFFEVEKSQGGQAALLHWRTASEQGNHRFELERSADGKGWKSIGWMNGHGTTNQPQEYRFTDFSPLPGVNYYRLRQMDFSGRESYSPVRSLDFGGAESRFVGGVFPNPKPARQDVLTLPIQLSQPSVLTLKLVDAQGRASKHWEFDLAEGEHQLTVPVGHLPSGIWYLQSEVGGQLFLQKLIVE